MRISEAQRGTTAAAVSVLAAIAALAGTAGCAASVAPRLPEDVAAALARTPMRRLESPNLVLYYPDARREEALRFLERAESCVVQLRVRAQSTNRLSSEKAVVMLPELAFNNAFAMPRTVGYEAAAVVPTYNTSDYFWLESGQPPDPAVIACHELAHYVHMQQIAGFAAFMNNALGQLYTPQVGLDSWFLEGLAVNYESHLQPGVGRMDWPFWHGVFAAGVAGRRINGGDMHYANRAFHGGNQYLVGSYFVRFLIDRYGEETLWKLVAVQARSLFFPLWVNVRFWQAYDKSLSTLLDEFADYVEARYPAKARPADQQLVRRVGRNARYARAGDGTEALIHYGHDRPTRLTVFAPDGRVRFERNLQDVIPPRRLKMASPSIVGGLSFTRDARHLYFAAIDLNVTFQAVRLLQLDLSTGVLRVVHDDLRGVGGSISPDGKRYVFGLASGDHHDLAELDLLTSKVRVLAGQPHGSFVSTPRFSPDGARIIASRYDGRRFVLTLFDTTGKVLSDLTPGNGPVYDASWVDDRRIVCLTARPQDVGFQVALVDTESGRAVAASQAPYLAFEPYAPGGKVLRFLNREGWEWTLDEVPLPALPEPAPAQSSASAPADMAAATPPETGALSTDAAHQPDGGQVLEIDALPASAADGGVSPSPDGRPAIEAATGEPEATSPTAEPRVPAPVPMPADSAPLPPPGPSPAPPPATPPPPVLSDAPYRQTDRLFFPQLHAVTAVATPHSLAVGLSLGGSDRLQIHRWAVRGLYEMTIGPAGFAAGYTNRSLAPVTISAQGYLLVLHDAPDAVVEQADREGRQLRASDLTLSRRRAAATLDVWRSLYENPVGLGFVFAQQDDDRDERDPPLPELRRMVGPHLFGSYSAFETTPYTSARRGVALGLDVAAFPQAWSTMGFGMLDLRAQATLVTPLPLWRRHTLTLGLRAHALPGAPSNAGLLQVGGSLAGALYHSAHDHPSLPDTALPGQIQFFEPLRGYEDRALGTDRIGMADLTYRAPFIIDWGTASTLGLLPSFFLRQLDLRLFATAASDGRHNGGHLAAGASLSAEMVFLLPLSLQYQIAKRLADDEALVHLVTLSM